MEYQLQQVLRTVCGRSSETIDPRQMALFSDLLKQIESQNSSSIESQGAATVELTTDSPAPVPVQRAGHGRGKFPDNLPRERIIHDLPEKDKPCPGCGTMRTLIGQESSEQLEYVPAQVNVIEHVRLKGTSIDYHRHRGPRRKSRKTGRFLLISEFSVRLW